MEETEIIKAVKFYVNALKEHQENSPDLVINDKYKPVYNLIYQIFYKLNEIEELVCGISFMGTDPGECTELTKIIHEEVTEAFKRMPSIGVFVKVARNIVTNATETLSAEKK